MEEQWLAKAKVGDAAAFEQLVTPYETMLWRVCWRVTGNEDDARDALQETMLKAWRAIGRFEARAQLSTWLYAIAVRSCQDLLRRRAVRPSTSLDAMREEGYDPPAQTQTPETALEEKDRREQVRKALSMLPEEQRVPLVLFAVEGRRYEEIAEMTGISLGTVKSRVSRGRDRLREIMAELRGDGNNPGAPASKSVKGGRQA